MGGSVYVSIVFMKKHEVLCIFDLVNMLYIGGTISAKSTNAVDFFYILLDHSCKTIFFIGA